MPKIAGFPLSKDINLLKRHFKTFFTQGIKLSAEKCHGNSWMSRVGVHAHIDQAGCVLLCTSHMTVIQVLQISHYSNINSVKSNQTKT